MDETAQPRLRLVRDQEVAADEPPNPAPTAGRRDPSTSGSYEPTNFADAFTHNYALVHRMLRTCGVESALLDDAAQDVFIVVHRRWGDYDGSRAFRSWLLGIVRKVASSYRRTGRRLRARIERLVPPSQPELERRIEHREQLARVEAFVESLGSRHREVFVLAELESLTAPEIAEILGLKLNTVYSRIRVARERFADWHQRERNRGGGHRVRTR
jgi:RNA polymerase sigma-70 factor (ECF subfamily)